MNQEWQSFRIGDLGRVITGKTPPSAHPERFGSEFPFITPSDIGPDVRRVPTERSLSSDGKSSMPNYLLPAKAVCMVCIGATIGKSCMTHTASFTNQQINSVVVDENRFDSLFVYYTLKQLGPSLLGLASGAATPIINKSSFSNVQISTPALPIQRRIASILSAYDDLIENNTRRIAILEEMARRVYEEWFVRFRFPGHEQVKMVESEQGAIPDGWSRVTLGEVAKVQWGDTTLTKASYVEQGYVAFSASGPDGFLPHFQKDGCGIVLSAIGAQCGKTWLALGQWGTIKNTMSLWSLDEEQIGNEYLYLQCSGESYWPRRGAAQPFISLGDARNCPVLKPTREVMAIFSQVMRSKFQLISFLVRKNTNLRATRDLLLPKLISGELDVSTVPAPEEAIAT